MNVFWEDVLKSNFDKPIKSKNFFAKLFIVILDQLKYLICVTFLVFVCIWYLTIFGLIFLIGSYVDNGELGIIEWLIIVFDTIALIVYINDK